MLSPEEVRLLTRLEMKLDALAQEMSSMKGDMKAYGKQQRWCREDLLTKFASAQLETAVISTKVLLILAGISGLSSALVSFLAWVVTK